MHQRAFAVNPLQRVDAPKLFVAYSQALELEEFRALERQITQDSGSVRGSIASLSSAPARQRHTSSTAVRKSMGLSHRSQQHQPPHVHAMHHPERHHSVRTQLSETNELLFEHVQGVRQAAQQRPPPRVTGNPFADPEEDLDHDDDSHTPAPVAAQQESEDRHSPVAAPLHSRNVAEQQQPLDCTEFGAESAWDAISPAAAPVPNSNEGRQVWRLSPSSNSSFITCPGVSTQRHRQSIY